ncbi:hypothetical protein KP509_16G067200 [Ceratopteris richardii]|uniref:Uncharacterized protein n=1 Tax=Ceratopteris richardii TaxID=49495 RepID=A0A8T2SZL6_CERRI|nr:hypothetical protein KP509_16G067200 [Ceratopteris richardii]
MDVSVSCPSVFWNFLIFLPFFLGLFLLGATKGFLVLPFSISVLSIGNTAVLLGLWPAHVLGTYYGLVRTKQLGPVLKVVLFLVLPVPLILFLALGVAGSILVGLGYGFFTPLVATFEAVREGREDKFIHCFVDGVWDTIKGSCTVVRDFTDFCYHSYFSYLKDFLKEPPPESQPYEIKVLDLPGCVVVGILGVLLDVPLFTCVAIAKSPFMLLRGWRRLLQDLIGREGPFLETVCVPVAGLAVLCWPLVVVIAILSAMLSSIFIGLYAAVVESSIQYGLAYIIAVVAQFDEYTNDLIYLREGSCLPRPRYRKKTESITESYSIGPNRWYLHGEDATSPVPTPKSTASIASRSGSEVSSTARSFAYSRSIRQTIQEVKMVQVWDNMFKTCELYGKRLIEEGPIKLIDLEEWERSSNSVKAKIIGVGLPAYSILKNLIHSGKAGISGLLLLDGVELTMANQPQDRVFQWFFAPLLILKEQIRVAHLKENEELYLLNYVLTCGDLNRLNEWQGESLHPEDEVRRGEMLAWSRRVQGIATSISRLPTFRRRYQGVVKILITFARINASSPAGKSKASSSESFSPETSINSGKHLSARWDETSPHRIVSPGGKTGGILKRYTSLDDNSDIV